MSNPTPIEREMAGLVVRTLNLEIAPDDIAPEAPLFYDGLGLDSIDALELALEISRTYGFEMRAADEDNERIFSSLRTLAAYVESRRKT